MANILLVEPQPGHQRRLVELLTACGHCVQCCPGYEQALRRLEEEATRFHLVITDYDLEDQANPRGVVLVDQGKLREMPPVMCLSNRLLDHAAERLGIQYACKALPSEWLPKIDLLLRDHSVRGCGFWVRFVHLFSPMPGPVCFPEEELTGMAIVLAGSEVRIGVSARLLLIADFLARYARRYPLTAAQIANGMSAGSLFHSSKIGHKEITERAVITSLHRLRIRISRRIASAGMLLRASDILDTEPLEDGNDFRQDECFCESEASHARQLIGGTRQRSGICCRNRRERGYRFRAEVEIVHPP